MAVTKDEILDAISKMSVMDVVELIADMERSSTSPRRLGSRGGGGRRRRGRSGGGKRRPNSP